MILLGFLTDCVWRCDHCKKSVVRYETMREVQIHPGDLPVVVPLIHSREKSVEENYCVQIKPIQVILPDSCSIDHRCAPFIEF